MRPGARVERHNYTTDSHVKANKLKLSKIELYTFIDEVKERLGFWGQLKSIRSGTKMERINSNASSQP
jgi:hypothetical protein